MIHRNLLESVIVPQFRLDITGIHGQGHWERVWENGQRIAAEIHKTKPVAVDLEVVELFAWLHDSQRQDENRDYFHGHMAGVYTMGLRSEGKLPIADEQFSKLVTAILHHNLGHTVDDLTIQTCWDADRLDLTRVGQTPDPRFLSPTAAGMIAS